MLGLTACVSGMGRCSENEPEKVVIHKRSDCDDSFECFATDSLFNINPELILLMDKYQGFGDIDSLTMETYLASWYEYREEMVRYYHSHHKNGKLSKCAIVEDVIKEMDELWDSQEGQDCLCSYCSNHNRSLYLRYLMLDCLLANAIDRLASTKITSDLEKRLFFEEFKAWEKLCDHLDGTKALFAEMEWRGGHGLPSAIYGARLAYIREYLNLLRGYKTKTDVRIKDVDIRKHLMEYEDMIKKMVESVGSEEKEYFGEEPYYPESVSEWEKGMREAVSDLPAAIERWIESCKIKEPNGQVRFLFPERDMSIFLTRILEDMRSWSSL